MLRALMVAVVLSLSTAALPSCNDGESIPEHVATCTILGGLIAQHLAFNLDCELQVSFLIDFGAGCALEEPTQDQSLACLAAVFALAECPAELPSACTSFEMQVLAESDEPTLQPDTIEAALADEPAGHRIE